MGGISVTNDKDSFDYHLLMFINVIITTMSFQSTREQQSDRHVSKYILASFVEYFTSTSLHGETILNIKLYAV